VSDELKLFDEERPASGGKDARDPSPDADATDGDADQYNADDIRILEGLEAVRRHPGMYIGDAGEEGFHHMVNEVVDNSIDEAMAGFCTQIEVSINPDESITVTDNGRGIPVDMHKAKGVPAAEVVLTVLHAGGKFDSKTYKVSGGLHGVGVSVVNALSEYLELRVFTHGKIYAQRYERGRKQNELSIIGETTQRGTEITFRPDHEIFGDIRFSRETLSERLRILAYLNRNLAIVFRDRRGADHEQRFHFPGGVVAYIRELNEKHRRKAEAGDPKRNGAVLVPEAPVYFEKQVGAVSLELAMQYCPDEGERIISYANNIFTRDGGTHLIGLRGAITRVIKSYAAQNDLLKDLKGELTGEDTRDGLVAVFSLRLPSPQFHGQTKTRLINAEIRSIVESTVNDLFHEYLETHPGEARLIVEKCKIAARGRMAARKAKEIERSTPLGGRSVLPGKLADCSERDPSKSEIYIVEGDSAGGTAKQGRDRRYQAVLPIRGKLLNVEKARIDKMLGSNEIKALLAAIGMGVGETRDLEKLRYHRIIIMTDADVDGSHIRTLLLTFFYRQLPELVENGHLYIAQPPLYRLQRGKTERYLKNETIFQNMMLELGCEKVALHAGEELITGEKLLRLLKALAGFEDNLQYLSRRGYYPAVLRLFFLLDLSEEEIFSSEEYLAEAAAQLAAAYARLFPKQRGLHWEVESYEHTDELTDERFVRYGLRLEFTVDGNRHEMVLRSKVLNSELFFGVKKDLPRLRPLGLPPYLLDEGAKTNAYIDFSQLLAAVVAQGQKGFAVQRFKGLGEMNAHQLWETTMDMERRTLLRVVIEDAEEAGDIFSVLMGDQVEPRREFIQANALDVRNLDV
jgi:DNA gyrase subunit B